MNYRIAGLLCFIAFGIQVYLLNDFATAFGVAISGKTGTLSAVMISR